MQHQVELAKPVVAQLVGKAVGLDVVLEAERAQVPPLVGLSEEVHDHDRIAPAQVQRPHQGAPYESGSARHEHPCLGEIEHPPNLAFEVLARV